MDLNALLGLSAVTYPRNAPGVLLVEKEETVTVIWTVNSNLLLNSEIHSSVPFGVDNASTFNIYIKKLEGKGNFSFLLRGTSQLPFSARLVLVTATGDILGNLFHFMFFPMLDNEMVIEPDELRRRIGDHKTVKLVATFFPEKEGDSIACHRVPKTSSMPHLYENFSGVEQLTKKVHQGVTAVWTVDLRNGLNPNRSQSLLPVSFNFRENESVPFDLGEDSFQLRIRVFPTCVFVRVRRVRQVKKFTLISFRLTVRTPYHRLLMHVFQEKFDFHRNESHEASFMDCGSVVSNSPTNDGELRIVCSLFRDDSDSLENARAIVHGRQGVLRDIKELFLNEESSDLTIKVENQKFQVHKSILSARCPFFAGMLKHDMVEKNTGVVNIPHYTADVFKDFLFYLYAGKVEYFTIEKALALYRAADEYDVPDLKTDCLFFMKNNLSVDAFCDIIALSYKYNDKELLTIAKHFFEENLLDIIRTESWKMFLKENFDEANKMYITAVETLNHKNSKRRKC